MRRFMISSHEEAEAKVLAELASLGLMPTPEQPSPRTMEYDDIAKLTYTTNAIKVPSDFYQPFFSLLTKGPSRRVHQEIALLHMQGL